MNKLLLDTDVLIDHLRGHRYMDTDDASISVITRTELFAGNEREELAIEALLEDCEEVGVDAPIARRAGRIKRRTGLQIADALIAATAIERQLSLMTRNRRHFEQVAGLTLHDPRDQLDPSRPDDSGPSARAATESANPPS